MPFSFVRTASVGVGTAAGQNVREFRLDHGVADSATTTYTIAQLMNDIGTCWDRDDGVQGTGFLNNSNFTEFSLLAFTASTNTLTYAVDTAGWITGVDDAGQWNSSARAATIILRHDFVVGTNTFTFYSFGRTATVTETSGDNQQFALDLDNCFNADGSAYNSDEWGNSDLTSTGFDLYRVQPAAFLVREIQGDSAETQEWQIKSANVETGSYPTPLVINCNFRLTDNTIGHKRINVTTLNTGSIATNAKPSGTLNSSTMRLQLFGGMTTQTGSGAANVTTTSASAVNIGLVRFGGLVGSLEVLYDSRGASNNWSIQPYDLQNSQGSNSRNIAHGQRLYSIMGGWPGTVTMPDIGCVVFKESYTDDVNISSSNHLSVQRYDIDILPRITGTATIGVYKPNTTGTQAGTWTNGRSYAHSGGAVVLGAGTIFTGINTNNVDNNMELRPLLGDGGTDTNNVIGATVDPDLGTSLHVWPDSYWDIETKAETAPTIGGIFTPQNAVFNSLFPDANGTQSGTQDTSGDVYLIRNYPFNSYRANRLGQGANTFSGTTSSNTNATPVIFSNMTSSDPSNFRQTFANTGDAGANALHIYSTFYTPRFENQEGTRYTGGFVARRRLATQNLLEAAIAGGTPANIATNSTYTSSPRDWTNFDQPYYLFEYAPDDSKNGYQLTWGCRLPRYGADQLGNQFTTANPASTLSSGGFDVWLGVPGTDTVRRTKVPFDEAGNTLDLNRTDVVVAGRETYWNDLRNRSHYESFTGIIDAYTTYARHSTSMANTFAYTIPVRAAGYSVDDIVISNNQPYRVIQAVTGGTSPAITDTTRFEPRFLAIDTTSSPQTITVPVVGGATVDPDSEYELVISNTANVEQWRVVIPGYYLRSGFRGASLDRTRTLQFNIGDSFTKSGSFANAVALATNGNITYPLFTFEPSTRIEVHNTSTETGHTWSNELFRHYTTRNGDVTSDSGDWESADDFTGAIEFLPLKMAKTWGRRSDAQKTSEMVAWMGSSGHVEKLSRVIDDRRIGYSPITYTESSRTAQINPTSTTTISLGTPSDTATDRANVTETNFTPAADNSVTGTGLGVTGFARAFEVFGTQFTVGATLTQATFITANDTSATELNPIVAALGTATQGRLFIYFDPVPAGTNIRTWAYYAITGYRTNTGTSNQINISSLAIEGDVAGFLGLPWTTNATYPVGTLVKHNNLWYQNLGTNAITSNTTPNNDNSWTRVVPKFQVTPVNADASFTTPSGLNETVAFDDLDIRFTNGNANGLRGRIPYQTDNITTLIADTGAFDLDSNILDCSKTTNPHVQIRGNVNGLYAFTTVPTETQFSCRGWTEMGGEILINNSASQTGDEYVSFSNCARRPGVTTTLRLLNDPGTHDVRIIGLPDGVLLAGRDSNGDGTLDIKAPISENTITFTWNAPPSGGHARFSVVDGTGAERYNTDASTATSVDVPLADAAGAFFSGQATTTFYAVISGNGVTDSVVSFQPDFTGTDTLTVNMNNAVGTVFPATTAPANINIHLSGSATSAEYSISAGTGLDNATPDPYEQLIGLPDRLLAADDPRQITGSRFGFQYGPPSGDPATYPSDNKLVIGVSGASDGRDLGTVELITAMFGTTTSDFITIGTGTGNPQSVIGSSDYNRLLGYRAARGDTAFGFIRNVGNFYVEIDSRYVVFAPAEESTQNLGYIELPSGVTDSPTATRDRPGSQITGTTALPFRCFFAPELPAGVSEQDIERIVNAARNQIIANL